jgi:hypothetical protein
MIATCSLTVSGDGCSTVASAARKRASASFATCASSGLPATMLSAASGAVAAITLEFGSAS